MSKPLSEMTLQELWELFPIQLTEHKEYWKDWYREEQEFLSSFLPKNVRIYHIGSTSIKGIWAKPIVDILAEALLTEHEAIKELLLKNGYTCMAQSKNRMDFNKGYTPDGFAERVFHLHLRDFGDHDELGASNLLAGDAHILIDLSSWYKASLAPKIELIHDAIDSGREIRFTYFSPKGESRRRIEPYVLVFQWSSWYVWGWCPKRQDFRLFKLNRMDGLQTGVPFEKRAVPLPEFSAKKVFPQMYPVKALFSPECKWRLMEEFGFDSFTEQPDGSLLFSFGFRDREHILSWILTFGGGAELLEPAELRGELYRLGTEMREKHRDS